MFYVFLNTPQFKSILLFLRLSSTSVDRKGGMVGTTRTVTPHVFCFTLFRFCFHSLFVPTSLSLSRLWYLVTVHPLTLPTARRRCQLNSGRGPSRQVCLNPSPFSLFTLTFDTLSWCFLLSFFLLDTVSDYSGTAENTVFIRIFSLRSKARFVLIQENVLSYLCFIN